MERMEGAFQRAGNVLSCVCVWGGGCGFQGCVQLSKLIELDSRDLCVSLYVKRTKHTYTERRGKGEERMRDPRCPL